MEVALSAPDGSGTTGVPITVTWWPSSVRTSATRPERLVAVTVPAKAFGDVRAPGLAHEAHAGAVPRLPAVARTTGSSTAQVRVQRTRVHRRQRPEVVTASALRRLTRSLQRRQGQQSLKKSHICGPRGRARCSWPWSVAYRQDRDASTTLRWSRAELTAQTEQRGSREVNDCACASSVVCAGGMGGCPHGAPSCPVRSRCRLPSRSGCGDRYAGGAAGQPRWGGWRSSG